MKTAMQIRKMSPSEIDEYFYSELIAFAKKRGKPLNQFDVEDCRLISDFVFAIFIRPFNLNLRSAKPKTINVCREMFREGIMQGLKMAQVSQQQTILNLAFQKLLEGSDAAHGMADTMKPVDPRMLS